jgi:hypothetical protein
VFAIQFIFSSLDNFENPETALFILNKNFCKDRVFDLLLYQKKGAVIPFIK